MVDVNEVSWFIIMTASHAAKAMALMELPVKHTHTTYREAGVQLHGWFARAQQSRRMIAKRRMIVGRCVCIALNSCAFENETRI